MAIFLGLAVAAAYGAVDFLGGRASREDHTTSVVAVAHLVGLVLLVGVLVVDGSPVPATRSLGFGAASGVVGLVGAVLLYRGLARGDMGAIASVTAVCAAVVPVTYGLATGERPGALALVGVVAALVAVALIASAAGGHEPGPVGATGSIPTAGADHAAPVPPPGRPTGAGHRVGTSLGELVLAAAAGAAFGVGLILLAESGDGGGFWPLLAARAASVPLVVAAVLLTGHRIAVSPTSRRAVIGIGVLDVIAVALYLTATRLGLISLVAVLGALSPVGTVVLARFVLHEHLAPRQLVGLVLALVGVVLIAS